MTLERFSAEKVNRDFTLNTLADDCTDYFTVRGESMEPKYCSGDVVVAKHVHNTSFILWGETYVVDIDCDCTRTIKNIHPHEDNDKVILRAANPKYAGDIVVKKENIISLYLVKGVISLMAV